MYMCIQKFRAWDRGRWGTSQGMRAELGQFASRVARLQCEVHPRVVTCSAATPVQAHFSKLKLMNTHAYNYG